MKIGIADEGRKNSDGSWTYLVEYDAEFRAWFLKDQGLKRMSTKRLQQWILAALDAYFKDR